MRHAFFSQRYKEGDSDVTCSWGISGDLMSFLVIDTTVGSKTDASIKLATDESDSRGILQCADGILCVDITGMVIYVTEEYVGGTRLPMSALQLTSYLGGGEYPLSLSGIQSYLHDCDT